MSIEQKVPIPKSLMQIKMKVNSIRTETRQTLITISNVVSDLIDKGHILQGGVIECPVPIPIAGVTFSTTNMYVYFPLSLF